MAEEDVADFIDITGIWDIDFPNQAGLRGDSAVQVDPGIFSWPVSFFMV